MAHDGESCGSGGCGTGGCGSGGCGTTESTPLPPMDQTAFNQTAFLASDEAPIHVTDKAVDAIKHAISQEGKPGDGLRVSVVGGGCSGYQYDLNFDNESRMGDVVMNCGGVTIYVDPMSAGYLKGTVIDFVSGLNGTGFKFNNPNAKRTCGCGSSFS